MAKYHLSACFGSYDESDIQCNGDLTSDSKENKIACYKAKECEAFTAYLRRTGKSAAEYLKIKGEYLRPRHGYVEFGRFCRRLAKKKKKKELKSKRDLRKNPNYDKRRDGPSNAAKRNSKKTRAKNAKERQENLIVKFDKVVKKLSASVNGREFATTGQVVIPGQLFIMDRVKSSGYIGIKCKAVTGRDIFIAVFKLKPWTSTFDVRLPFYVEELEDLMSRRMFKKLKPESYDKGNIRSLIKDVKKSQLALLIEFITDVINENVQNLPRVY